MIGWIKQLIFDKNECSIDPCVSKHSIRFVSLQGKYKNLIYNKAFKLNTIRVISTSINTD